MKTKNEFSFNHAATHRLVGPSIFLPSPWQGSTVQYIDQTCPDTVQ
jgi:hypothetical protein